jgi:hypothetical protein
MRTFLLCLLVLTPAGLFADPLSPQEAYSILRQAQQASREIGSFKEVKTEKTKYGSRTVTIYTLRQADGTRFSRTETVTTVDGHPERTQTKVRITTPEGNWQLFKRHALLFAFKVDPGKVFEEVRRQQQEDAGAKSPETPANPSPADASNAFQDRLLTSAVKLGQHATTSGERFEENGRRFVRVVSSFDEEGQKQMTKLAEEQWAEMKKEIPWAVRLLVTPILAVKGGVASMLPVRTEHLIDEEQSRVLETTTFNGAGKMLAKSRPSVAERIPALSPEIFAIPPGLEIVRAASMGELLRLTLKIEKEEKAADKAALSVPASS